MSAILRSRTSLQIKAMPDKRRVMHQLYHKKVDFEGHVRIKYLPKSRSPSLPPPRKKN